MTTCFAELDRQIEQLLAQWDATIGSPTCHKGCSNCCRVAVAASSGEAAALLGHMEARAPEKLPWLAQTVEQHVRAMVAMFARQDTSKDPLHDIWKMGSCPFLVDRCCSIYESRPYACRAVLVWHDEGFCGTEHGLSHVPAELMERRDLCFWETMRRETEAGRRPFHGQLTVVLYYLMQHAQEYLSGQDLTPLIHPAWLETRLIQFVAGDDAQAITSQIDRNLQTIRSLYQQDHPHGLPRVSLVSSVADLQPTDREDAPQDPDVGSRS